MSDVSLPITTALGIAVDSVHEVLNGLYEDGDSSEESRLERLQRAVKEGDFGRLRALGMEDIPTPEPRAVPATVASSDISLDWAVHINR